MQDEETIRKAYALTAQAADETQEDQPMESATAFVIMRALAWVLGEPEGEEMFEEVEEEFEELMNEEK